MGNSLGIDVRIVVNVGVEEFGNIVYRGMQKLLNRRSYVLLRGCGFQDAGIWI